MKKLIFALVVVTLSASLEAWAYPDFIGYGYSSCITCHYNGQGGGALNDYGRALFATEITARDYYPAKVDEEEIAARSGFLGKTAMPWWVRPGIKYRGLWFQQSPGSKNKAEKFYNMQADLNLNFFLNKKQTLAIITTPSYLTTPRPFSTGMEDKTPFWFMKEYYARWMVTKNFVLYVGQLDKVFGIRQSDHTAYSRAGIGLGQLDQSQGAIFHFTYPTWDIAINTFFGNAAERIDVHQKGASISGEYQVSEKFKLGASALSSKSESIEWKRLAIHSRAGISKGSALLAEGGLFENKSLGATAGDPMTGAYIMLESLANLRRGYNILSTIEYRKADIKSSGQEISRWSFGALMFPLPRTEVRLMAVNGKSYDPNLARPDSWQLQSQLHLSW